MLSLGRDSASEPRADKSGSVRAIIDNKHCRIWFRLSFAAVFCIAGREVDPNGGSCETLPLCFTPGLLPRA
jgi:hypothetical protein